MNRKITKWLAVLVSMSIYSICCNAMAEVVVIANKAVPVTSLSVDQVSAIFLKRSDSYPDGTAVVAIDLPNDDSIRDEFYKKATHKNANQVKSYWAKRIFTGKGSPNDTEKDEADVKSWVSSSINHIGYISAEAVDDTVKVLLRLP